MDRDELREEADEWVDAGIVTREQADAIVARYDDGAERSRLVTGISLVGAALVGAGVLWFVAEIWTDLPRVVRTLLLVLAPIGFAASGERLWRARSPRVGHALWLLGAAFVGPSLFLLSDVWALELDAEWLLFAWGAVALPAGHVRTSRPTAALGLLAIGGALVALEEPADLEIAAGLFGVVAFAIGAYYRGRGDRVADAYRLVGTTLAIATLLFLSIEEWNYDRATLEATPTVVALAIGAVGATAVTWRLAAEERLDRSEARWVAAGAAGTLVGAGAITLVPRFPGFFALLVVHALLFGLLLATVAVAAGTGSRAVANLAAIGVFFQILVFLGSTVIDAVSGAGALVFVGAVLLAVALGLERGRRELLDRIARRE